MEYTKDFNYIQFIAERYEAQQEYAEAAGIVGPLDEMTDRKRCEKVIEFIGHMIEETIEARVLVPRRSWKTVEVSFLDDQKMFDAFVAEMYDILLFHAAALAYAGVTPDHFAKIIEKKNKYNAQRTDHNKNVPDPIKELHGDCQSSTLKPICENPDEELTGQSLDNALL
ncbi:MAG: hypothetical protein R3321_05730 [Nitrososphaeraceae archaeon]|nr:hypothetical protein [Nitrososphaeraceae archaeon]